MRAELVDFPKTSFVSPGRRDDSVSPGLEQQEGEKNKKQKTKNMSETLEEQPRLRGSRKMLRSKEREKKNTPGF